MKRKKLLSVLLSAAMVASMAPMNVAANGNDAQRRANLDVVKLEASKTHEAHRNFDEVPKIAQDTAESATNIKPNEMVTVIIDYEKEPILEKVEEPGEYENYAELVADNKAEVNAVEKTVETVTDKIEAVVKPNDKGEEPETLYEYTVAFSGSAMKVAYKDIKKIKKVPGVHEVYLSQRYAIPKLQEVKDTPNMLTSRDMMHVTELQEETGFTGRGSLVAVLDTGVAYEHDAFAKRPKSLALDARGIKDTLKKFDLTAEKNYAENTKSSVKQLCASGENVSAEEITKGLDNGNVYKSDKIPFGYDYSNHDSNPTPTNENNHGTHVAGTVAADCDEITGVAPEAQIAAMKVFRDDGYAYQEELMAALQDCVMIGVDSVNMSLGSSAGFTKVENSELQTAYENVGKAGINLNISAGNNYTSAYGSNYGNYTLAENPDEGVVGTPSTLEAALSVAAIENTNLGPAACIQVGDTQIGFHDNGVGSGMGFDTLGAGTFEIVDCGLGKADEFPETVEGKIALVSRGEISFADKDKNAFSAGAIGLIVYNNQSGSIGMSIDNYYIPAVSILKSEGEFIKETMVDGVGTISYDPAVKMNLENPDAYKICEFSSWGTTPDLTFKPEITAPGGNIWSAYYVEDGVSIYGSMSGTSMAAPHMAGAAAVMKQYVNESTSKSTTNQEKRQLINALEMSTAAPVEDEENGTFYSPRCQGAGLVNLKEATSTPAYLSVTGNEKPAAALGYNTDGEFSYTVTINRFSQDDDALKYQVKTTALTEDVLEEDGKKLAAQYDIDITDAVEITYEGVDEDGYVTLPEGEDEVSFTVNLKVNKDAPELAEVVEAFENGFFVEGFTQLFNEDASDLSVPFMGFCGDWAKVPMFDKTQYEEGATFNSGTGLVSEKASWSGSSAYPLGVNWFKYLMDHELEYDEKYAVLSDHSALGTLDNVYPNTYLLRGAAKMDIDLVNEKGETVESFKNENVRKTYYNFSSGNLLIAENFMDELPYVENTYYNPMEEGTYQYVMSALPGGVEDTEENRQVQRLTFHVDNTDPVVKSNSGIFVGDNGNLWMELECEDNYALAGLEIDYRVAGQWAALGTLGFEKDAEKEQHFIIDLGITHEEYVASGASEKGLNIELFDYALNMTEYEVDIEKKPEAANTTIKSVENTANGEMTVTINESKGATGYVVLRATKANGKYTKVGDVKEPVFVDKKATTMKTTYFYKVQPYADGKYRGEMMHVEAELSPEVSCKALTPAQVTGLKVAKNNKTIYNLTWKQVTKADGYEVYKSVDGEEFELYQTLGNKLSTKTEALEKGKTYTFKVRGFVKDGQEKVYGEFSQEKSVTVK